MARRNGSCFGDDAIDGPAFERAIRKATRPARRAAVSAAPPVLNLDEQIAAACANCALWGERCCALHGGRIDIDASRPLVGGRR